MEAVYMVAAINSLPAAYRQNAKLNQSILNGGLPSEAF